MTPTSRIVYFAGVSWDDIQGTDKHMALRLSTDATVLWVDPPRSIITPLRGPRSPGDLASARRRSVAPGIERLTILAPPFPGRTLVAPLTAAVVRRAVRRCVDRLGWPREDVAVVVSSPEPRLDVLPDARYIYYATDDFVAGAGLMGMSADQLRRAERRQVAGADALVAISPEILDRWGADDRPRLVLPNGCDPGAFEGTDGAPLPRDVTLPGPVVGVVGQMSARLDIELLEAIAESEISLLLVGPMQPGFEPDRVARLLARKNVQWVGVKPFAELPSYLRVIDVGLTPYADSDFNRASFPLKTLEYLAAGRGAVSTPLPAVGRLATPWISVARDPQSFVDATRALLAQPRTPALHSARVAYATEHSWESRAGDLMRLITSTPGRTRHQ